METVDPLAREFVLFCINRCGKEWPALYDEMCRVAGQRLFRGLGYDELRELGLSFGITRIDDTVTVITSVIGKS